MSDNNTIRPDEQRLVDGVELLKATEGQLLPDHTPGKLTAEHADYLAKQAVDVALAESLGVRSLTSHADTADLGDVWVNWANYPAILFPWTAEDGRTEYQVRPDDPTPSASGGRPRKYVFRKGMTPVLWAVRPAPDAEKIVIVEGTKQCLAAASYAPPGVAVYGIAGCRSWQIDGQPIPDLEAADGREVVVILDADAADNPEVYNAGTALAAALTLEGATKVTFGRLPAAGKSGLDDVLAAKRADRRASYLARIIDSAKPKPADKLPKGKKKNGSAPTDDDGRVTIVCNADRRNVINELTGALIGRWDGDELFNHGGVISRRVGTTMHPVDRGSFNDLVQETAMTVNEAQDANGGTSYTFTWPDPSTMTATMSRAGRFSALDRISHAPFVRPDGSIVTEPGYDEQTRTLLMADPVFEDLKVPEDPSPEEIAAARDLLLTEWLGDFPFDDDADRANVLALIVTPAIRGMVPKVPMAVIDGLQMGVGKNLLADSVLTVYTGGAAQPMNWVSEPEELRKQITSAFRGGSEFFVFDEAHTLEGAPLAQALTAETWQDRILGVSTMANFPNTITWMSLGNNVQVRGDLTRRVYRIALRPKYSNPQDRDASSFRHPGTSGLDLLTWTRKHRRELMGAVLTIVRAWFAQGQPRPARGVSFGSFEVWEKIVGGIVETAGLPGFLGNLKVWRSESDFDTQYWHGHLKWLREQFGARPFRTADVRGKAMADPGAYLAPPKLDDPADKGYGKSLGEAYSRLRGRRYDGYWVERDGTAHGHVSVWKVFEQDESGPTPGNPEPEPTPLPVVPEPDADERADSPAEDETRDLCGAVFTDPDRPNLPAQDPCGKDRGHENGPDTDWKRGYHSNGSLKWPVDSDTSTDWPPTLSGEVTMEFGPADPKTAELIYGGPLPTAGVVTFDLETGDADDLYRAGPGYVRIGAVAKDSGAVVDYDGNWPQTVPELVAEDIRQGATITGHNIMAFDLPALVNEGVMTMPEIHRLAADGRVFDALLAARFLDPPMARDKGVDAARRYDLKSMGERFQLGSKLTDMTKALVKRYGGWANIPIDDSEDGRAFKAYMVQDVELSRRLHSVLLDQLGGTMPDYLLREHRVAALAAQIRHNGFRVDVPELNKRVAEIRERKADAMAWLAENCGIPTADAKGKAYKSPLATKAGKAALTEALREAGVTSLWTTPSTGEIQVSADHMMHIGQEHHHSERIRMIARNVHRIVSARVVYETVSDHLCGDRVHPKVGFEQATGRWSVTKPGMTVLGKRGGKHVERMVFLPEDGHVIIAADLSQVDMRAVAGLSQDQAYIDMLRTDDPHSDLAVALFSDAGQRETAKAIGHGWNYGESLARISKDNDIDPAIVWQFDVSMRERFPRLVEWRDEVREVAASGQLLDNGFGRKMRPDPQRAHTQGPALMGQGAARDIMMEGLLRMPAEILPMLRTQVHDEIVLSVPADQAQEIGRAVVEALSFTWKGVPIMADVSRTGQTWGHVYEKG